MNLPLVALLLAASTTFAALPGEKTLPRGMAAHERGLSLEEAEPTAPPPGPVHSLGEWEESEAVMTLWSNPSWVAALAARGPVKILTDSESSQSWWNSWLEEHGIPDQNVSYFTVRTDSIWVRDYGPWWIVDGEGAFGIVDSTYNRPRPNDDKVPQALARKLGLPLYQTGLVHTGGNYYNDGIGNGFSSTLVYRENPRLEPEEVNRRMLDFLGIARYVTSPLAPKITIEHLDTFGKLVTADTWVFSQFPAGSKFRADSEKYAALLSTLTSPYGTPYRILRVPMTRLPSREREEEREDVYRAYLNSFISNRALYYPIYGDSVDEEVKGIYQKALPGYEIVGVDARFTSWGDSVHCRSRNLLKARTLFLFPRVENRTLYVEARPAPGAVLTGAPQVHVTPGHGSPAVLVMEAVTGNTFRVTLPEGPLRLWVTATDSAGNEKLAPAGAPAVTIDL